MSEIDESLIGSFERDGAIVVRNALPLAWIERLRAGVDRLAAAPAATGVEFAEVGRGRFFGDLFLWRREPEFRDLALSSPLPALAAALLRSATVNLFYDQLFVKEPRTDVPTPWHHDQPYWPLTGQQILSIWVPLDPVTPESGVLRYVRGSHLWGRMYQPQRFGSSANAKVYDDSPFAPMPDIDGEAGRHEFLTWSLEPGDVLVHQAMAIHGAAGNSTSDRRRRAVAVRYAGDDARYDPRPATFMDIPAVKAHVPDPGLASGAPLGGPLFPIVWPLG